MTELTEFLLARIKEDEMVARAAIDPESPGKTWHWVTTQTDTPVAHGDALEALIHQRISLRTTEEFPTSAGNLPAFAINEVDEIATAGVADHIARHDPARVLAECAAKRAIVERESGSRTKITYRRLMTLQDLASVYSNHPDYREEWRERTG